MKLAETACPFCGARTRAPGKSALATIAGATAMTVGLGCAYGMPSDYGVRDSGSKPDVVISDANDEDHASPDASVDASIDAASEASADASTEGG
jgi:hypothetical protein